MIRTIGRIEILHEGPNHGDIVMRGFGSEPFMAETGWLTMEIVDQFIESPSDEESKENGILDHFREEEWRWRPLTGHERIALTRFLARSRRSVTAGTDIQSETPGVEP